MQRKGVFLWLIVLLVSFVPARGWAQNFNATISGVVTDPTAAAIPQAKVTLTFVSTGAAIQTTSATDGSYSFANLMPGTYNLKVSARGFSDYVQSGIQLAIAQTARQDVQLKLGAAIQTVEVMASASPLNFETPTQGGGIGPQTLKELPLMVSSNPRSAIAFAILQPGISTGGRDSPYDARVNGGLQSGDEAELDGVSMQEGFMSQNGMVSLYQDWPMTPDMVSEVKVQTSNYAPQFGSTTSGVLQAVTKSGTNDYHFGAFDYLRNTWLNARPFDALNATDAQGNETPGTARPPLIQNNFGAFVGGSAKHVPKLWGNNLKTYFYVDFESFRTSGGVSRPTLTIPTAQERTGDFSDWKDSSGNVIPIYDPATTAPNPSYNPNLKVSATNEPFLRQQFMGCDGLHPNVICSTDPRLANSLAPKWFQYLPPTNLPGIINNYALPKPVPDTILNKTNYWLFTSDQYIHTKHHIKETVWYQGAPLKEVSALPEALASETNSAPQYTNVDRISWDWTIAPTMVNNFHFGYLDRNEGYGAVDASYAGKLPQIPGVVSHHVPPELAFGNGYATYGTNSGINALDVTRRPTAIPNDMLTWIRGKHELSFGVEYRWIAGYVHNGTNEAGYFYFDPAETGLPAPPSGATASGNAMASFILGQVDSGNYALRSISADYPRQHAYTWFVGDTWKATSKLTVTYGVRWDEYSPFTEKFNRMTFLDPLGANPAAGGLPGRLAYSGTQWGSASFGRLTPENVWHKGFAPRLGVAYSLSPKNVIRTGYGIFYDQAFYPNWGAGIAQDGFTTTVSQVAATYGASPAFILSQGFSPPTAVPPFIDSSFDNGRTPLYRGFDANRLPYAQQWNLSVEHQFTRNFYINAAYVANKGTRLPSRNVPLNVLNPSLLSMGGKLNDTFQSGMTSLDGVSVPYAGWVNQINAGGTCKPTVAQALLPYPQYCGTLFSMDENAGGSIYHSLQVRVEKQMSHGMYLLGSYTWSKLLTSAVEGTQADAWTWDGVHGDISPYQRWRNKGLASDDVPQVLSLTYVYDLPFGAGKRFANKGGILGRVVGGWQMAHIVRASSGLPLFFRSGYCNIPGQFSMGCLPGIIPSQSIWAQSKGSFDPGKGPLFNINAFEPASDLVDYQGSGTRMTSIRGFGFHGWNMALIKNTKITEKLNFQLRAEFFNLWNWHVFNDSGEWGGLAFNNDINSPNFGKWNTGDVTDPRNIQIGVRLDF